MVSVYLSPIYLLICFYVFFRLRGWLFSLSEKFREKPVQAGLISSFIFLTASPAVAFLLPSGTAVRRVTGLISSCWLGTLVYAMLIVAAADLIGAIARRINKSQALRSLRIHRLTGIVCLLLTAAVSVYGVVNAGIIRTTPYEITVNKRAGSLSRLNITLIADLHLGYSVGQRSIEQMVEKINRDSPDLVVIAGDFFDNDYDAMDDPEALIEILKDIKSKYGVYACYGNHDVAEKILVGFTFDKDGEKASDPRMDDFLERAGIRLLRDEGVLIEDSFYLYGRPDYSRPGKGITQSKPLVN